MTICFHLENNPVLHENLWKQDALGIVCEGTYVLTDVDSYSKIGSALWSTIGEMDDIYVMRGGCVYKVNGFGTQKIDEEQALIFLSMRFVEEVYNSDLVLRRTRKMDIVSLDGDSITVKPVELRRFDSMTFLLEEIQHHGYTVKLNGSVRKVKTLTESHDGSVRLDLYSA